MELFSKVYNCYYQVVARILDESLENPMNRSRMQEICDQYGFGESGLNIIPKLIGGEWGLMEAEGQDCYISKLDQTRKIPITHLQKKWLKALTTDGRFQLFFTDMEYKRLMEALADVEPLFCMEDFHYFDQYTDGDLYKSSGYRENFLLILEAVKKQMVLEICYRSPRARESCLKFLPCRIQYSGKDDKMRVFGVKIEGRDYGKIHVLNLSRIKRVESCDICLPYAYNFDKKLRKNKKGHVVIEISGARNSLERCMLHFANYEKRTVYDEDKELYICTIYYDPNTETEVLIEILSFGPVIRVTGPECFLNLVKERVKKQHYLLKKVENGQET